MINLCGGWGLWKVSQDMERISGSSRIESVRVRVICIAVTHICHEARRLSRCCQCVLTLALDSAKENLQVQIRTL